jgi:hypothetical protein
MHSGVMDLHETHPETDGQEQHRTLFAMHHDDLASVLAEAALMLPEFLRLFRPLRLGWLKHRNISIARGIDPVSDDDIAAVTRKHKRRLALDAGLYDQNVFVPEFLEEVYDFPDGNFDLGHKIPQRSFAKRFFSPGRNRGPLRMTEAAVS